MSNMTFTIRSGCFTGYRYRFSQHSLAIHLGVLLFDCGSSEALILGWRS